MCVTLPWTLTIYRCVLSGADSCFCRFVEAGWLQVMAVVSMAVLCIVFVLEISSAGLFGHGW